jgi:hypothetical protein
MSYIKSPDVADETPAKTFAEEAQSFHSEKEYYAA